ncbi:transposase [Lactobacillus reuteri]|nr:transposase [Limosilactobacillus reuteri]MBB1072095.1 transposase [Limosilactobacillus reuteri]
MVHRRKKAKGVRQANLDALPQVDKIYKLKGKNCLCDTCGEELMIIGKHLVYREVKCKPMELYCENSYAQTGKYQHCENLQNGNDMLVQAATPHPFAVHSYFSASIMAEIIYNKFVLTLPLHRQAQNWPALIPLSSKAMADQVIKNAEAFEPLYKLLHKALEQEDIVHLDETPLRC